ncbi:hypothetical protein KPSA1_04104 [Pseudomonas syringae pv. actinidiae]|uniref:Uncharacterized protein n=1 Tax=Pseudomonas syringae pv. actinidiae TaxID=103796 RepID=A0A2V0QCM7_PSESF|nr:hypothetical protein KPSA1_04104 [Pseudomonas syringae pv. actinidiae]
MNFFTSRARRRARSKNEFNIGSYVLIMYSECFRDSASKPFR